MEYVILSESLVYYAAYDPKSGKYKAQRTYSQDKTYDMSKITLYKSKETAEKYGSRYGCPEAVKIKLIRIQ